MCQKGGEGGKNSDKLKGGSRASCYIQSPVSKRPVKKSGSVVEISSIFLQDGVGGASKINNIETLTKDESQNWRQKLAKFKSL